MLNTAQGLMYLHKELELKQNLVGQGFTPAPDKGKIRINIMGEITKGKNFEAENIYLNYELNKGIGWHFDYEEDEVEGKSDEVLADLNRESSTTQLTVSHLEDWDADINLTTNFCFPLDWQFLVNEDFLDERWPTIVVQVNSLDAWDRFRIEGYGFFELPRTLGTHHLEIKTYKPLQSVDTQQHQFFVGGGIKVKDFKQVSTVNYKTDYNVETIINRYGISTETSGSLYATINIVTQSRERMDICRKKYDDQKYKEKLEEHRIMNETHVDNSGVQNNIKALMRTDQGLMSRFTQGNH